MSDDNVLTNVVPWGLHKVPDFVRDELKARAKRYAWNVGGKNTDTKAVRTAWLRICSNGMPKAGSKHPAVNREDGFVFYGINGKDDTFYSQFGIRNSPQNIGYGVSGIPHVLSVQTFPNRPPPAIQSVEVEFYGAGSSFPGLCRKATINWKCFSVEQLEYLTPYLLSARVSMVLEWGWNTYNPQSLINLNNVTELLSMYSDGKAAYEKIKASGGDYDCHVGRIIEYGYTMDNRGNYTGRTVVVNPSFMVDGMNIQNQVGKTKDIGAESLKEFMKNKFDNINSNDLTKFSEKEKSIINPLNVYKKPVQKWRELEPTANFWVNMRFVQDLFNLFCSVQAEHPMLQYNFADAIIGAHPLMKAVAAAGKNTNVDVLIPNSNAPRLMRTTYAKTSFDTSAEKKTKVTEGGKRTIADANVPESFKKSAEDIAKTLKDKKSLSDVSDDLKSLMKSQNSFPMYDYPPANRDIASKAVPGYWGYLGDIYISNVMLKDAVEENDTIRRMLDFILGKISECGSNFWEFQVIPQGPSNITVMDNRFNPITSEELANELPNFVLGKTEDSSFQEYGMEVVMKNEMAMQTLLSEEIAVDPKGTQIAKAFTVRDRLYKVAPTFTFQSSEETEDVSKYSADELKKIKEEELAQKRKAEEDAVKELNDRSTEDDCVILEVTDESSRYFLIEKDPEFMKSMLQLSFTENISALSTPMMPDTPFNFKCQGIGGFSFMSMFTLSAIPEPYDKAHAVFQVDSVKQTITDNNWSTDIVAKVRPLVTLVGGRVAGT